MPGVFNSYATSKVKCAFKMILKYDVLRKKGMSMTTVNVHGSQCPIGNWGKGGEPGTEPES